MDLTTIDPIWWVALGTVVLLLIGLLIWSGRRNAHRTEQLKDQFKSEYDRTAASSSRKDAEDDLERRTARRSRVDLADLKASDAESMQHHLDGLLRSFVDGPQGAALAMAQLVGRVAVARGYVATEGNVLDLVSVDHPEQVAAMRRAEADLEKAKDAELTEVSRRTFLAARALAERILAEGRVGHMDEGGKESSDPAATRRSASDVRADEAPPAAAETSAPSGGHDQPSTVDPNGHADASSGAKQPATDREQTATTTGGSLPRQ